MDFDEILRIGLRSAIIFTIALAIGRLFFWLARRDRAKTGVRRPRKSESFVTALSPEAVLRILKQEMGRRDYQIEETVTSGKRPNKGRNRSPE